MAISPGAPVYFQVQLFWFLWFARHASYCLRHAATLLNTDILIFLSSSTKSPSRVLLREIAFVCVCVLKLQ